MSIKKDSLSVVVADFEHCAMVLGGFECMVWGDVVLYIQIYRLCATCGTYWGGKNANRFDCSCYKDCNYLFGRWKSSHREARESSNIALKIQSDIIKRAYSMSEVYYTKKPNVAAFVKTTNIMFQFE
jgi:hypothetical protein